MPKSYLLLDHVVDSLKPRSWQGDKEVVVLRFNLKVIFGHFGRMTVLCIPFSECRLLRSLRGCSTAASYMLIALDPGLIKTIKAPQPMKPAAPDAHRSS
jgi:hypothetical protein